MIDGTLIGKNLAENPVKRQLDRHVILGSSVGSGGVDWDTVPDEEWGMLVVKLFLAAVHPVSDTFYLV